MYRETLEVQRETLGNQHPDTLTSIGNLGVLLEEMGDPVAAELLSREALEASRETLGNRHPNTLSASSTSYGNLGRLLKAKRELAAASAAPAA